MEKTKLSKGFACLSAERRKELAAMGGKSVPNEKRAFSKNRELAKEAGRRGGLALLGIKRSKSKTRG